MNRSRWALAALLVLSPVMAAAQDTTLPPRPDLQRDAYEQRRRELLQEVEQTQQRLTELRTQRMTLQARLEAAIAADLQRRAQQLLMSEEQGALQQLDTLVVAAQDNLLMQRDRFRDLGAAVRQRTGAVLVVLLRADSSQTEQNIASAEVTVDNAPAATRTYSAEANGALRLGAVDQLYRADILPTTHTVRLQAVVNGQPVTQTFEVNAPGQVVTYVQFAVRNGQVVPTTWTSRGTTPF